MARTKTHNNEGLTDIPEEDENSSVDNRKKSPKENDIDGDNDEPTTKSSTKSSTNVANSALSCSSWEEAQQFMRDGIQLFERVYNWGARLNQTLEPSEQLNFMAIKTVLRPEPLIRDGKVVTDSNGAPVMEQPCANIQIKLPLVPEAVSLPLHQAVLLPGGK